MLSRGLHGFGAYSNEANALFAQGYNIYSYVLVIATAGIPSAISKLVAHYNGINQYGVSRKLYHSGMYVSMAMGLFARCHDVWRTVDG